ncbi:lipopolysaccharide assembly protein LapB [Mesonia sp. K7]|uniref:tetratricopeptide repeat protein n=1 Tax=Mesonia sp. K7 TaxID=2218606 RepID=UPI000DA9D32C|nr:tetratricopeptide repeat protein [Mesonia sp. K7]PZD78788.1 hypothetical protein DNG35_04875 [Mesonia sp. K7]
MKNHIIVLLIFFPLIIFSQNNNEKLKEAIKLMDAGKLDESIVLLQECANTEPDNYIYPYEIALAYVYKKDYKQAIKILDKAKKLEPSSSQIYQLLGNSYSYLGKPKKAIQIYEKGMKLFPDAGNLYLEKGNVYWYQQKFNEAVDSYKKGIEIDPMFSSNYFRLAKIYLKTNDKLSGLIYGELFMNLERNTARTEEMSELLFFTYKDAITIEENKTDYNFCEIIVDVNDLNSEFKVPFCLIFVNNFLDINSDYKEVNLLTLSKMRTNLITNYFKKDYKTHPNILLQYLKKIQDNNYIDEYNHYIFQKGFPEEFEKWAYIKSYEYSRFLDWYSKPENTLEIKKGNIFKP